MSGTMTERSASIAAGLHSLIAAREVDATDIRILIGDRSSVGRSCENWPAAVSWHDSRGAHEDRVMVRLDPPGAMFSSSRADECRLLEVLDQTPVPVPTVMWLDEAGEHLPAPSLVTQFVAGHADENVLTDADPLLLGDTGRADLARQMASTLATIHGLGPDQVDEAVGVDVHRGDELARALHGWSSILYSSRRGPEPEFTLAHRWMSSNRPTARRPVVVHGDWKPDNFLIQDGRIASVLDWEMVHLGNPVEDLAWWASPPIRNWVEVPGKFTVDDFLRTYCEVSGCSISAAELRYWSVVTMYKMAALAARAAVEFAERRSSQPRTAITARRFKALMLTAIKGG